MGPDSNERWHVCPNELLANCDPGRLRRIKEAYPSLEVAELSSKFTVYEFSKK
jgi:hypothetical protein